MPKFVEELAKLKEFLPGLITTFQYEGHPIHKTACFENTFQGTQYALQQYEELLQGYLYAQTTILPTLRREGIQTITPTQFLSWVKQLYKLMTDTISKANNLEPGEFASQPAQIWHYGLDTEVIFSAYCNGDFSINEMLICLASAKFPREHLNTFLELCVNYKRIAEQVFDEVQKIENKPITKSQVAISELMHDWNLGRLSQDKKEKIYSIVKIGMLPELLPNAMQKFSADIMQEWQQCDANDVNQILKLVFNAFYQLNELHPYPNGNLRVAQCLANIILRYFNLPSLIFGEPTERDQADSLFNKAFNQFKKMRPDSSIFISYLQHSIKRQRERGDYHEAALNQLCIARMEYGALRQELVDLTSLATELEINKRVYEQVVPIMQEIANLERPTYSDLLKMNFKLLECYQSEIAKIKNKYSEFAVFTFEFKDSSDEKKKELSSLMNHLTGVLSWKVEIEHGKLSGILNNPTQEQTNRMLPILNNYKIGVASLQRSVTGEKIILVQNLNESKLKKASVFADNSNQSTATNSYR